MPSFQIIPVPQDKVAVDDIEEQIEDLNIREDTGQLQRGTLPETFGRSEEGVTWFRYGIQDEFEFNQLDSTGTGTRLEEYTVAFLGNGFIAISNADNGLDDDARFVLGIAIVVMLGVLPLIEIDEYRHIDTRSTFPNSVRFHAIGHLIPLAIASVLGQALARGVSLLVVILLGLVFVVIPSAIVSVYFSTILERELRENRPNRRDCMGQLLMKTVAISHERWYANC